MATDDAVIIRLIPLPGAVPPATITEPDWTAMDDRVTDLEAGVSMDDITDGRATGIWEPVDGDIWRYNGPAGFWEPFGLTQVVESVSDTDSIDFTLAGTALSAEVKYAGSGAAATAARSDHSHTGCVQGILTGTATGVLSSGTRTLSSATLGTLASGVVYDLECHAYVRVRNNVNSGTINLLLRVGTDGSYPQRSRNVQNVGGVPVDQHIAFIGTFTGAGSGLALSWQVQYSSGDASDIRDWEVVATFRPRK